MSAFADHLANLGKIVMVAALDGTFQKKVCTMHLIYTHLTMHAHRHTSCTQTHFMHPHRCTCMPAHQQDRDWEWEKKELYLVNYVISITVILADSVTVHTNRMIPKNP